MKSSTKAKIIVIKTDNKAERGGRQGGNIDVAQQKAFKSPGPHLNSNLQLERLGKVARLGK